MAVYMIIEIKIKNKDLYSEYISKAYDIVIKYGGKYLARGSRITPIINNNWNPQRLILIEFKNTDQAQKCFQSPEYLEIAHLRENSAIAKAVIIEGQKPENS